MAARAKQLIYQGTKGSPREGDFMMGIPARDLDAADITALTDDEYRDATGDAGHGPLYAEPAASEPPAEKVKKSP